MGGQNQSHHQNSMGWPPTQQFLRQQSLFRAERNNIENCLNRKNNIENEFSQNTSNQWDHSISAHQQRSLNSILSMNSTPSHHLKNNFQHSSPSSSSDFPLTLSFANNSTSTQHHQSTHPHHHHQQATQKNASAMDSYHQRLLQQQNHHSRPTGGNAAGLMTFNNSYADALMRGGGNNGGSSNNNNVAAAGNQEPLDFGLNRLSASPSGCGGSTGTDTRRTSTPSSEVSSGLSVRSKSTLNSENQKTILCKYFLLGKCKHGDKCTFAHGNQELRVTAKDLINDNSSLKKTKLCRNLFENGVCQFGPKCVFAHGLTELQSVATAGGKMPELSPRTPQSQQQQQGSPQHHHHHSQQQHPRSPSQQQHQLSGNSSKRHSPVNRKLTGGHNSRSSTPNNELLAQHRMARLNLSDEFESVESTAHHLKSKVCKHFSKTGKCWLGEECKFYHGSSEAKDN